MVLILAELYLQWPRDDKEATVPAPKKKHYNFYKQLYNTLEITELYSQSGRYLGGKLT